jgi:hypothetical protein
MHNSPPNTHEIEAGFTDGKANVPQIEGIGPVEPNVLRFD